MVNLNKIGLFQLLLFLEFMRNFCTTNLMTTTNVPDFYSVLKISRNASSETIRNAYIHLARSYHPDLSGTTQTAIEFLDVMKAYNVLKNVESRKTYDNALSGITKWRQRRLIGVDDAAVGAVVFVIIGGLIGVGTETLKASFSDATIPRMSVGGCDWFGRGPVCAGVCPIGYEEIRKQKEAHCGQSKHNSPSHCFGGCDTIADQNFGSNCWNPGGVKRWCCFSDIVDSTWGGLWLSSENGSMMRCRYEMLNSDGDVTDCGMLDCYLDGQSSYSLISGIDGQRCNSFLLFNQTVRAYPGMLILSNGQKFFKTSVKP